MRAPIGIVGSTSANALAAEADLVLAIGTRLMDFTTGSWTCFTPEAKFISINAARWDATKHQALAVVGDARETVDELAAALAGWKADATWMAEGARRIRRHGTRCSTASRSPTNAPVPTYAQVVGVVNAQGGRARLCDHRGRRPSRRDDEELAGQVGQHLRLRIRLLLHGLRDCRRLGCRDGRPDARDLS